MFKQILKNKIVSIINSWGDNDIYAISFLIHFNESSYYKSQFKGIDSFPEVTIMSNTESNCEEYDETSEERWNIAFWEDERDEVVIDSYKKNELADELLNWYKEIGVKKIGYEDEEEMYDDEMGYIGKGPNGYRELASLLAETAREIHSEEPKFSEIPIIINDYEYSWYTYDFTKSANPDGQAEIFLKAYKDLFE